MLADVAGDVHDGGNHALRDKAAAVAYHADSLAVAREQGMRRVAHVGACGRVGGEYAPFGGGIVDQHVNADGACRVKPLDNRNGGDVKT
ncbi:hypothetical protein D9M73_61480 [compost metagenome]